MRPVQPSRLSRRILLGVPALMIAAGPLVVRPTAANARPSTVECVADLLGAS